MCVCVCLCVQMQECSNKLGVPMNCIFPVKNYHEENNLDPNMDSLILDALKNVVNFANDYVETLETDSQPSQIGLQQLMLGLELSGQSDDEQSEGSYPGKSGRFVNDHKSDIPPLKYKNALPMVII